MTQSDPVLVRLGELSHVEPDEGLSRRLRAAAHSRLAARRVHPGWTLLLAASVVSYLGWAVHFASAMYR